VCARLAALLLISDLGGALLAHLRLAHLCTVIHRLVHLCTVIGGALLAQIPFATSMSKVHCQVLDSDITATDLNAAAATCVFGDEITPLREVREYSLRNLVRRQRGQLKNLTFFPIALTAFLSRMTILAQL
jgi:hypothetical protein